MRILIQNCKTKKFLTETRGWTQSPERALDFGSTSVATEYSTQSNLEDVQVVLKFSEPRYDLCIPLSTTCREATRAA